MVLSCSEEIVSVESEHGIVHAGAVIRPTNGPVKPLVVVWVRHNATSAPRVDTALIPGADHSYAGHEAEIVDLLIRSADSLASPSPRGRGLG